MAAARRPVRVGALAATAVQVISLGAGAIVSFVIARRLGAEGTGIYAVGGQFVFSLMMFGGLGLRTGIAHEVSAGRLSARAAAAQATVMSALLGIAAGALGFALYELGSETVFEGISAPLALALCAAVPFAIVSWVLAAIPLALEDYEAFGVLQSSGSVAMMVLVAPMVLLWGIDGALLALVAGLVLAAAIAVAWAARHTAARAAGGWQLAESLRLGVRGWILEMLQLLLLRPDIVIVAAYGTTADAGVYSLAVTITTIGWILPQALGTVALPRTASLVAASPSGGRGDLSAPMVARALRHGTLLAVLAGVLVAALLLLAPLIFGQDFDRTVALGMIMLPGVIALALGRVMIAVLLGLGRGNAVLAVGLAVVPAALLAYLLAVPGEGPTGAALVSLVAYLLTTAGAVIALRRAGVPLSRESLVPRWADLGEYRRATGSTHAP